MFKRNKEIQAKKLLLTKAEIMKMTSKAGFKTMAGMIKMKTKRINIWRKTFITITTTMIVKCMVTVKTMTKITTLTKNTTTKTKKIGIDTEIKPKMKRINTMRRTNIGTNKTKKIGTSVPELIEFNTVTKRIDTGTNKTNCTMILIMKMIKKKKMKMTTISTGTVKEGRFAMKTMNFAEKEAIFNNADICCYYIEQHVKLLDIKIANNVTQKLSNNGTSVRITNL